MGTKPKAVGALTAIMLLAATSPARAVVYLPDKALESMIVSCDVIVVGKVSLTDPNTAQLAVTTPLKGDKADTLTLHWPSGRRDSGILSVKDGENTLLFLTSKDGKLTVAARMPLRTDAEERTIVACYAEIAPLAPLLADLADAKKQPDLDKLRPAVNTLADSKNAFTQIILGRLMAGPLATRVDPAGFSPAIAAGLKSTHAELSRGAAGWAGRSTDPALAPALADAAKSKDALTKTLALRALDHLQSTATHPDERPHHD